MKTNRITKLSAGLITAWLLAAGLLISAGAQAAGDPAQVDISSSGVSITPPNPSNFSSMVVQIANPDDSISEYRSSGEAIYWDSNVASDGVYRYEVRVLLTSSSDSEEAQQLYSRTHGWFIVSGGVATPPPGETSAYTPETSVLSNVAIWLVEALIPSAQAVNLFAYETVPSVFFGDSDLGAQGASSNIFAIKALDAAGSNRFLLSAHNLSLNSSNNIFDFTVPRDGGSSATSNNTFTLNTSGDIGFADGSVFIDRSSNFVGIGTTTPAGQLHIVKFGNPTIRLDDANTGVWEIKEFFDGLAFRDVTENLYPLFLDGTNGRIGMGHNFDPSKQLDVSKVDDATGTANTTAIRVQNASTTTATRVMFDLINNGGVRFDMLDQSTGNNWVFQNQVGTFDITLAGTGTREFRFNPNGNLEIAGVLIQSSSRTVKQDIIPVDHQQILDKVLALPIAEWSYIKDAEYRHIGPMAEDFYAAFELGHTDKGLSSVDTGGIALAAIQGLHEQLQQKEDQIATLQAQFNQLQRLVVQLVSKDQVATAQ